MGMIAFWRAVLFLILTIVLAPIQLLSLVLLPPLSRWLPVYYFRIVLWILDVQVHVRGDLPLAGTLVVSNHISWLDIVVLGAQRPTHFIAKSEIAGWPLFGQLAKLNRTIFINRGRRADVGKNRDAIAKRLATGDCMTLFPEGTSSDGLRILPFKSGLFSAVMPSDGEMMFPVQPVSMVYTRKQGLVMGRRQRAAYGWYGDTELVPHLLYVLNSSRIEITLNYHTVPSLEVAAHRKELARYCQDLIAQGMREILEHRLALGGKNR